MAGGAARRSHSAKLQKRGYAGGAAGAATPAGTRVITNRAAAYDPRSIVSVIAVLGGKKKSEPRFLLDRVESVEYLDSGTEETSRITVALDNSDEILQYDPDLMGTAAVLGYTFGYVGLTFDAGQFVIKEFSGKMGELRVVAHERQRSRLSRARVARVWEACKRSDAVRSVLGAHGFIGDQLHVDDTTDTIATITQTSETDWEFVQRLANLEGREFYLDTDGIHWEKPRRKEKPSRLLRFVKNPIGLGEIIDYGWEKISAGIPGRIVFKGFDPLRKKAFIAEATRATVPGLDDLVDTPGPESPADGNRLAKGNTGFEVVQNLGARTVEEAKRLADSLFRECRYGAMNVKLNVVGDPTLKARTVVAVWGIGPGVDGLHWLKEANHTIGQGYETKLDLTREGLADKLKIKAAGSNWSIWDEFAYIKFLGGSRRFFGPWTQ